MLSIEACDAAATATAGKSSDPAGGGSRGAADAPTTSFGDAGTSPGGDSEEKHGLCGPAPGECLPDNDGFLTDDGCATAPDAGIAPTSHLGCHVTKGKDGAVVTQCGAADARGLDGASCSKSSDCAPGFDCTDGEKGPVCRRYCCAGSCANQLSSNGGDTFCDVRMGAGLGSQILPVCMPIKACKLLHESDCGEKETCAVVTEKGATSCVPKGEAKVGQPCNDTHCDTNLTCLGSPGDRRCYKLCRVDSTDCGPTETCTTGAVFQDTSFGVCK